MSAAVTAGPATTTIVTRVRDRARRTPGATAMRHKDRGIWRGISWAEYWDHVELVGNALLALGVEPGDRVAIHSENHDIAEAAGISRPTVYKYTKNKRWLLDRMLETVTGDLSKRLRGALDSDADAAGRLREVIGVHVRSATEHRTCYAIVFSEQTELSEAGRRRFRAWARAVTEDFRALLDECVADRDVVDTSVAANLMLSMLTSLYRWYGPDGPVSPEQLAEQIMLLVGGVMKNTG